jgi:hypothetical protein
MTGFYGGRVGQFYGGSSNDVTNYFGDGGDDFWSANIHLGYNIGKGYRIGLNLDMHYGKTYSKAWSNDSKTTDVTKFVRGRWINYDGAPAFDKSFNNASNYLQITMPGYGGQTRTVGIGFSGRSAMWPSNKVHNGIHPPLGVQRKNWLGKWKDVPNTDYHFHHIEVPHKNQPYFKIGLGNYSGN